MKTKTYFQDTLLLLKYKSFVQPHFDYYNIIHDRLNNETCNKIERNQYNAALVIMVANRG